jgi:hypothetical protein
MCSQFFLQEDDILARQGDIIIMLYRSKTIIAEIPVLVESMKSKIRSLEDQISVMKEELCFEDQYTYEEPMPQRSRKIDKSAQVDNKYERRMKLEHLQQMKQKSSNRNHTTEVHTDDEIIIEYDLEIAESFRQYELGQIEARRSTRSIEKLRAKPIDKLVKPVDEDKPAKQFSRKINRAKKATKQSEIPDDKKVKYAGKLRIDDIHVKSEDISVKSECIDDKTENIQQCWKNNKPKKTSAKNTTKLLDSLRLQKIYL